MNPKSLLRASAVLLTVLLPAACSRPEGVASSVSEAITPIAAKDCRTVIEFSPAGPWRLRGGIANAMPVTVSVKNNGNATWGGAIDMRLGVVWFEGKKSNSSHSPNLGEQWWPLPGPLAPGETLKFDITVDVPRKAGQYSAWFSLLQPGVMWCFHTGDPPTEVTVSVEP